MPENASFERLPNTFLLGAAKAGTTTLSQALAGHSQVFLPFAKEPEFFSQEALLAKGIEWYQETFYRTAAPAAIRLDATPHYLYWSEKTAPRIAEAYAQSPKFIVVLRDPVDRAYSWYWNMVREGLEDQSFPIALQLEETRLNDNWERLSQQGLMTYGYVRGSRYAERLAPFFAHFPPSAFHWIKFDDLSHHFPAVMKNLCTFLDIPLEEISPHPIAENQAAATRSTRWQQWLRKDHCLPDWFKALVPEATRYQLKGKLRAVNQRKSAYPPMEDTVRKQLREKFADDLLSLAAQTGLEVTEWLAQ